MGWPNEESTLWPSLHSWPQSLLDALSAPPGLYVNFSPGNCFSLAWKWFSILLEESVCFYLNCILILLRHTLETLILAFNYKWWDEVWANSLPCKGDTIVYLVKETLRKTFVLHVSTCYPNKEAVLHWPWYSLLSCPPTVHNPQDFV